jgi:hypothetical protein
VRGGKCEWRGARGRGSKCEASARRWGKFEGILLYFFSLLFSHSFSFV